MKHDWVCLTSHPAAYETSLPDGRILSIAVVTHNRKQKLQELLKSILESRQIVSMLARIIIVDDSPVRTEVHSDFPDLIDYVWLPDRVFITRAKNIAWRRATTPLILFVDDDNIVNSESVMHLIDIMEQYPRIGAVMPSVSYRSQPSRIWVYSTPFRKDRWSMNLAGRNSIERALPDHDLMNTDALPNAFMIRRSVLLSISGFDEEFIYNNSCDLCQRIKGSGFEVYASTVSRFHHDVPLPGQKGYWADHVAADVQRAFPESRDWTLLMRKIHGKKSVQSPFLYVNFIKWVLQVDLGMVLVRLSSKQFISINISFLRGFLSGAKVKISTYYRK
ncbi:MAG: glycosyltransferase [Candidatus Thermoplasmatota archaeon]|nr:glycosyltransferase [Candidatus Thermoplasmatota archaeon]